MKVSQKIAQSQVRAGLSKTLMTHPYTMSEGKHKGDEGARCASIAGETGGKSRADCIRPADKTRLKSL